MDNKYTNRMFFIDVINGVNADAVKAFATAELAKLDARNEKRKGNTKTAKENAPIKDAILAYVKDNPNATAGAIATALGTAEAPLTTAKVSALATQMKNEGILTAVEVKAGSGKGKVKAYTAVEVADE